MRATTTVTTTATAVVPADPVDSWGRGAGLLSIATVLVSAGNYGFSLFAVHVLSTTDFAMFAATQGLLLVIGTGCMAAVPWAMAKYMAIYHHPDAPREAMHFGLLASAVQALVVGAVAGVVMWLTAGPAVAALTAVSAAVIAMTAASTGYLQGEERVATIGWLRVMEVCGRVLVGLILVMLLGRSAVTALLGFPVGAVLLLGVGSLLTRRGLPPAKPHRSVVRDLMRQSLQLGLIQVLLSMLAALDGVVAQGSRFDDATAGSYQAAALLGRVPLFLSGAIGIASYTAMAGAADEHRAGDHLRRAVHGYIAVAAPMVVACWTVPAQLLAIVIPVEYDSAPMVLRFAITSGALIGLVNVITTGHQARGRFRSALRILVPAALAQPLLLLVAGRSGGLTAFVWTLVAVSAVTALLICFDARAWRIFQVSGSRAAWLVLLLALIPVFFLRAPALWLGYLVLLATYALRQAMRVFAMAERPVDRTVDSATRATPRSGPAAVAASAPGQGRPRRIVTGSDRQGPRIAIMGDSYVFGLGYTGGPAFGRLAAEQLGFSQLLNIAASSRSAADTMELYGEQLTKFRPEIAILAIGGTEALVHPRAGVQRRIEKYAPAHWHGVAGLAPRASYSSVRGERTRQRLQSGLKVMVKWLLIRCTGGGPRVPLPEANAAAERLVAHLAALGTRIFLTGLPHVPGVRFPGTEASYRRTDAALAALAASEPAACFVPTADQMLYYDDFLDDRLHLDRSGHERIASLLVAAVQRDGAVGRAPAITDGRQR